MKDPIELGQGGVIKKTLFPAIAERQISPGLRLLSRNDWMLVFEINESYWLFPIPTKAGCRKASPIPRAPWSRPHCLYHHKDERDTRRIRSASADIEIESEVCWDDGARRTSIYFRDPAGNSIELAPPNLWTYLKSPAIQKLALLPPGLLRASIEE
ncbi:MAG: hypothetical protein P8J27_14850 [Mariniblastus sp.]|nr:hypothetical protein [Mariniblastus sp.]